MSLSSWHTTCPHEFKGDVEGQDSKFGSFFTFIILKIGITVTTFFIYLNMKLDLFKNNRLFFKGLMRNKALAAICITKNGVNATECEFNDTFGFEIMLLKGKPSQYQPG